jgi:hypothetical protein
MKNAGMAGAVALVGIGLISIALSNVVTAPQAVAAPSAVVNDGPEEPQIVAFGSLGSMHNRSLGWDMTGFYRLWSDGRLECRVFEFERPGSVVCHGNSFINNFSCIGESISSDTGWFELPEPPGGDGFACRTDVNGDRQVDGADLGMLLAQWGQDVSCDPQPTYPCFDLGNLDGPVAFR